MPGVMHQAGSSGFLQSFPCQHFQVLVRRRRLSPNETQDMCLLVALPPCSNARQLHPRRLRESHVKLQEAQRVRHMLR